MLFFKACPRCKGDLFDAKDQYGFYISCLQCGFQRNVEAVRLQRRLLRFSSRPHQQPVADRRLRNPVSAA
jgi:hypothetical protein